MSRGQTATVKRVVYNRVHPPAGVSPWTTYVTIDGGRAIAHRESSASGSIGYASGAVEALRLVGFSVDVQEDFL